MILKNKYKYILSDRFGMLEVSPLGEGDLNITYEQEDEGKYFYTREFRGKITFTGDVFQRLKVIEKSMYICTSQRIQVYRLCDQSEQLIFDGTFKLTEGDWDDDKCTVVLKFEKSKIDKCLDDNKTVKINLLNEISPKITVKAGTPGGVLEYAQCDASFIEWEGNPNPTPSCQTVWCGGGIGNECDTDPAYAANWVVYGQNIRMDGQQNPNPGSGLGGTMSVTTKWVREVVTVPCGTSVPPEWVLIESCTGGNEKYAKKVNVYNCRYVYQEYQDSWNWAQELLCDIPGAAGGSFTEIDNGVLLNSVIKLFVNRFCGLQVISDFFQINPANPSDTNYVTQQPTQVNHLVVFQKSDVKRPNDLNNATNASWTFEKLMETLRIMFNVYYAIDNGVFRLEHISWFSRNQGYDLTIPHYEKYVKGMRKYSYDLDNIPQSEKWLFKEQLTYGEWGINEIDYNTTCAIGGNKAKNDIYTVEDVTTDVELCLSNPGSDNSTVDDSGFVIIATTLFNSNYFIITEGEGRMNNSLSWSKLIPRYQFYNRPVNKGIYNEAEVKFKSTKPFKKGAKFSIPIECGEVFNPNDTIKTELGLAIVDKATFNLASCMMELELKYNVFDDLTDNQKPVINGNSTLQTYKEVPLTFAVSANDPDGVITKLEVKQQPANGHVDIISTSQAKYTPNPGFTGSDYFLMQVYDNWNEVSDPAGFLVNVLNTNQPPVANDDHYFVYQGEPFTSYPGIFANDSDDVGFTLVTPNVTTALGIPVSINNAGIFTYTPPAGYEGQDSFVYTIEDNQGLQSSATVTLTITFKNKPIAVDDHYNTMVNTPLVTDGTTAGQQWLWANDYTPDGNTYTYTCTAETKATANGGTVTINTNGTFSYTPPAGFTGTDSFTYTVWNVNGSGTGTAYIHVNPVIYVQLYFDNLDFGSHVIICNGMSELGGQYTTQNVNLKFWADSAKTIPYDVTGMNFKVNLKETNTTQWNGGTPNTNVYTWTSEVLSGSQYLLIEDFMTSDETRDCGWQQTFNQETDIELAPGNYIIVN